MEYFDPQTRERFIPHVIEPASGLTRGVLVLLIEAYDVDESRPSPELMRFKPSLAPIKAGIFPLTRKDGLPEVAQKLYMDLRRHHICQIDEKRRALASATLGWTRPGPLGALPSTTTPRPIRRSRSGIATPASRAEHPRPSQALHR